MTQMTTWRNICGWLQRAYCVLVVVTLLFTLFGWALSGNDFSSGTVKQPTRFTRNIRYLSEPYRPVVDGRLLYLKVGTVIKVYTTTGEYLYSIQLPETKGGSELYAEDGYLYIKRYGDVYVMRDGVVEETLVDDEADAKYMRLKNRPANGNTDADGTVYTNVGDDIVRTDLDGNTEVIVKGTTYACFWSEFSRIHMYAHILSLLMIIKMKLGFQPLNRWT